MSHRRKTETAALLVLCPLVLAACGDDPDASPVRLQVTVQGWTGWSEEQPEPTTTTHVVEESETFIVYTVEGELEVTVAEVGDDEVELETSEPMAPRSEDGDDWNYNDTTTEFTLVRGGGVELATTTLDEGTLVTITAT